MKSYYGINVKLLSSAFFSVVFGGALLLGGCGGVLNGGQYIIPERQTDCEIRMKFTR